MSQPDLSDLKLLLCKRGLRGSRSDCRFDPREYSLDLALCHFGDVVVD